VWSHVDHQLVLLRIDDEIVVTTSEHPFLTSKGEWVTARELRIGTPIRTVEGDYGMVKGITDIRDPQPMYNLTVDIAHTYAVGEAQGVEVRL
jgi:hypothetical protein